MKKKWSLLLIGSLLSALMLTGCNDNQEPPPEDDTNVEQAPEGTDPNGLNGNNGNNGTNETDDDVQPENDMAPGVDQNDTMTDDDENDRQGDPEDAVEDAEDINDRGNKDQ